MSNISNMNKVNSINKIKERDKMNQIRYRNEYLLLRKCVTLFFLICIFNFPSCGRCGSAGDNYSPSHEISRESESETNSQGQRQESGNEEKPSYNAGDSSCLADITSRESESETNSQGQRTRKGENEARPSPESEQSRPIREQIMDNELIWDDTEMIELYPNSFLYLEISVDSDRSASEEILYHVFSLRGKEAVIKYGKCLYPHRPKFDDKNKFILDYMERLRLKLKIGEKIYSLGEVIERDGHTLKAMLPITKKMLEGSLNEAYFIIDDSKAKEYKRKFDQFGECEGREKPNYQTGLDDLIFFETLKESKSFRIDATIQYYQKVDERE